MTSPDLPMNDDDPLLIRPETNDPLLAVSLLKQYTYCPRVVYYETCTPGIRPTTYKMLAGHESHERERHRAARRSLFAYHVPHGTRHFDVRLRSAHYNLSGLVDEVVVTPDEAIIVDYKLTDWAGENHLIQVAAYGLLVEEALNLPVHQAFIYLMTARRFEKVLVDVPLRNSVLGALAEIKRIREQEYMPPPVTARSKCVSCEFRRFCNDV